MSRSAAPSASTPCVTISSVPLIGPDRHSGAGDDQPPSVPGLCILWAPREACGVSSWDWPPSTVSPSRLRAGAGGGTSLFKAGPLAHVWATPACPPSVPRRWRCLNPGEQRPEICSSALTDLTGQPTSTATPRGHALSFGRAFPGLCAGHVMDVSCSQTNMPLGAQW